MSNTTFDGVNKYIQLPSTGSTNFTAEHIYRDWKQWAMLSDNLKYLPAFDSSGGDPVGDTEEIAPYFFARNDSGWRVRMPDKNGELVVTGNLFPREHTTPMFLQATNYDSFLRLEVSTRAVVIRIPQDNFTTEETQSVINNTNLIPALL